MGHALAVLCLSTRVRASPGSTLHCTAPSAACIYNAQSPPLAVRAQPRSMYTRPVLHLPCPTQRTLTRATPLGLLLPPSHLLLRSEHRLVADIANRIIDAVMRGRGGGSQKHVERWDFHGHTCVCAHSLSR